MNELCKKICAIHQPNFFPWLGYFNKIHQADYFVFLDKVAYPKAGSGYGTWCNRNKLLISGKGSWFGCPVRRKPGVQLIKDIMIVDEQPWRKKIIKTIGYNYSRSRNFDIIYPFLKDLILYPSVSLAAFNIHAIKKIANLLNVESKFFCQSDLDVSGSSNELLINIVKAVGAGIYLCGNGASGYQNNYLFNCNNLEVQYQNFIPQDYRGDGGALSLSVIDYLMVADLSDLHFQ